jgi:hypothetical protein
MLSNKWWAWVSLALASSFWCTKALAGDMLSGEDHEHSNSLWTALAALLGVAITAVGTGIVSWRVAQRAARGEYDRRQSELALQISEIVSSEEPQVRQAAMRRFAVAVLRVKRPSGHAAAGSVFFVPMNSRITIGRDDSNDVVLKDDKNYLSRWHCGLMANSHDVWIDDYESTNGTAVNRNPVFRSRHLQDNDVIHIGPYEIVFREICRNEILSKRLKDDLPGWKLLPWLRECLRRVGSN